MALAEGLDSAALDRWFEMGMETLRRTLHHLWAAERIWLDRWIALPNAKFVEPEPGLPVAALWERFRQTARQRNEFLDTLDESRLDQPLTYTNTKGVTYTFPLADLLLHVCNHGVHHRAQAMNMLRHNGRQVPGIDYQFMKIEPAAPPAPTYDTEIIHRCFQYGDWANERLRRPAEKLDDERLDRPFEMGVGSLRKTLLHINDAERWWVNNWTRGPSRFEHLPATTSMAELADRSVATARRRDEVLAGSSPDALRRPTTALLESGREITFELGETMLQLFGHGTHHRAQALNMLRRLGAPTPEMDYLLWCRETRPVHRHAVAQAHR